VDAGSDKEEEESKMEVEGKKPAKKGVKI